MDSRSSTQKGVARQCAVSNALIVCGGPAFSMLPEACFDYLEPDVGLSGDAVEVFAELADLMQEGAVRPRHLQGLRGLPGVVYRVGDEIMSAPQCAASGLTKPPRLEDLDLDQYRHSGFGVGVNTTLNWYASTVESPAGEDQDRIVRAMREVVDEVRRLRNQFDLHRFFFIDPAFNQPLDYARALCQSLLEAGLEIQWNSNLTGRSANAGVLCSAASP